MSDSLLKIIPDDPQAGASCVRPPNGLSADDLRRLYQNMVMIRAFDERQHNLQRSGRIGFCVTSTGEEAVSAGVCAALQERDWIFPYYRQHGMLICRGVPLERMMAHLFGNAHDPAQGRQMPAHFSERNVNFVSASSVIGTQVIHAVGAAMAAKYKKDPIAVAAFIGDGGTSANDFHSALTFAGVSKAPVVIYIVNNQYAISLPTARQCAAESLHLKGQGYGLPALRVDGNDAVAIALASREALGRARSGEGPTLIELVTYRLGPHSSSDDPSRYRDESEAAAWAAKDPLVRMRGYLEKMGLWDASAETEAWEQARTAVMAASAAAEKQPEPAWATLFEDVYAEVPPSLALQRDEFLARESGLNRQSEGEFPL